MGFIYMGAEALADHHQAHVTARGNTHTASGKALLGVCVCGGGGVLSTGCIKICRKTKRNDTEKRLK